MYNKNKLKINIVLSVLLFSILTFYLNTFAQVEDTGWIETTAGYAILTESSTGKVLFEKNADKPVPPASITKLMTLLLGFEAIQEGRAKWDDMVPVSEKAWRIEGSRMFLEVDHDVEYEVLMTGISVVSANDGCIALAEYLYGSESAFVQEMNRKAAEIGLTNTQFKNSTGLPSEGHKMSAKDIAMLARYIIGKYPKILEFESQSEFTFNDILQYNRNPLLGVFPGADGLKTGWTEEAGHCLVSTAKQNDMRMISVVLNTENEEERFTASQEILNYGFNNFEFVDVKTAGDIVDSISVEKGKELTVPVRVDSDISVLVPSARRNHIEFIPQKNVNSLNAPVSKNTPVGTLEVQLDGEVIATADISTTEDVQKAGFLELLFRGIRVFFKSLFKA